MRSDPWTDTIRGHIGIDYKVHCRRLNVKWGDFPWWFRKTVSILERWRTRRKFKHRERFCRGPGLLPPENVEIVYAKFCILEHFVPENCSQCRPWCVFKHFNNGNAVKFLHARPRNDRLWFSYSYCKLMFTKTYMCFCSPCTVMIKGKNTLT